MSTFHELTMPTAAGEQLSFRRYEGQACLVVNLASQCGLTPQYAGLRALQEQGGVAVLGFPCNQFGAQEPGTNEEILEFARSRYDANFEIFAKVEVNGDGACELYRLLKSKQPKEDGDPDIAWNFTKFLVDGDGEVLARYEPQVAPQEVGADAAKRLAGG